MAEEIMTSEEKLTVPESKSDRGSWTSASNAREDLLCEVRHLRQQGLPETPSNDSDSGTRVHKWTSGGDVELTHEEQEVADAVLKIEQEKIQEHLGLTLTTNEIRLGIEIDDGVNIYREVRFWTQFPNGLRHSGQVDLLIVTGNRGFISERKSLWGKHTESSRNLQVRDQVTLVMGAILPLNEVAAIVNQPRRTHKPEVTVYSIEDCNRSYLEMQARVTRSHAPDAKATPGEVQCKFCRAKSVCPEFKNSLVPVTQSNGFLVDTLATMPGDKLAQLRDMAGMIYDATDPELRKRLKEGEKCGDYKLSPGSIKRTIIDPQVAYNRTVGEGHLTHEQFMRCMTLWPGKLDKEIGDRTIAKQVGEGNVESRQCSEVLEK